MTYSTQGLTPAVRAALTKREALNRKVNIRARVLDADDTEGVVKAVKAALKQANDGDQTVVVTRYGGIVPNVYLRVALCDKLTVEYDLAAGTFTVEVDRVDAPRRKYGKGATTTAHIRKPGQWQGRIVEV